MKQKDIQLSMLESDSGTILGLPIETSINIMSILKSER